jgi:hypothetical protein
MRLFNTFKAGDVAPTSGVYATLHSTPHKLVERAAYVEGDKFRGCRICPMGVWYRLEAQHVSTPLQVGMIPVQIGAH